MLGAAAAALVLPTHAAAKPAHYDGTFESSDPAGQTGHAWFDVARVSGHKRAYNFGAEGVPAECDNGTVEAELKANSTGSTKVKQNKFTFKVNESGLTAKWSGKLKQRGAVVDGRVSLNGLIGVSGTVRDCHTGKVAFSGGRV
jgi:hypothetical protein